MDRGRTGLRRPDGTRGLRRLLRRPRLLRAHPRAHRAATGAAEASAADRAVVLHEARADPGGDFCRPGHGRAPVAYGLDRDARADGPPCVLFAGRVVEAKGIRDAISAWRRSGSELPFVVAGTGPLRREIEAEGVEVPGWLDRRRLSAAYRRAAVLVMPSRWQEPFGIVGLEALTLGTPVAAWDSGGVREWHPGSCSCPGATSTGWPGPSTAGRSTESIPLAGSSLKSSFAGSKPSTAGAPRTRGRASRFSCPSDRSERGRGVVAGRRDAGPALDRLDERDALRQGRRRRSLWRSRCDDLAPNLPTGRSRRATAGRRPLSVPGGDPRGPPGGRPYSCRPNV